MDHFQNSLPIGSMYAIYGNIYHQYTPNVSIYTIHGSYGLKAANTRYDPVKNAWYHLTNSLKDANLSKGTSATEISTQTHSLTFTKTFHQPIDLLRNEDTTLASTCVEFFYLLQSTTMVSLGSCIIQYIINENQNPPPSNLRVRSIVDIPHAKVLRDQVIRYLDHQAAIETCFPKATMD